MKTFGNGQTNGKPVAMTNTPTTLHTAPAGSAVPHLVEVHFVGADSNDGVHVSVHDSTGAKLAQFDGVARGDGGAVPLSGGLPLNGGCVVKAWADGTNTFAFAMVDDQANAVGTAVQSIASGLVAAVQNASRFAINAQGGTGQATEANANIRIARAGTLRNMIVAADATVGGGATVTVTVRKNGADTALAATIAAAQTTVAQSSTNAVTVSAGDLVTFKVATDNAGAPAANVSASVEYVAA